jgi:hypothetical protein
VRGTDRLDELFGRHAARRLHPRRPCLAHRLTAAVAEACSGAQLGATGGANTGEQRTAGLAEACAHPILMVAARAIQQFIHPASLVSNLTASESLRHSEHTIVRPVSLSLSSAKATVSHEMSAAHELDEKQHSCLPSMRVAQPREGSTRRTIQPARQ